MNDSEKYVAMMTALGKISKSMDINLQFNGDNFEEMLFQFALESREQVNKSWLHMFNEVTGTDPGGIIDAATYLKSTVDAKKKSNSKKSKAL
mgnify:CR=1 FL=1